MSAINQIDQGKEWRVKRTLLDRTEREEYEGGDLC